MTSSGGFWLMGLAFSTKGSREPIEGSATLARRGSVNVLDRKTLSAGAVVTHVRIVELEAGSHQALDVVDLGATQQHGALEVDVQPDAVSLQHFVAWRFGFTEF